MSSYTNIVVCNNHNTCWLFNPGNEFNFNYPAGTFGPTAPASTLTITGGGGGWITGVYNLVGYISGFGTQSGTHNMVRVQGNPAAPAPLGSVGGMGWITGNPDTTIHYNLCFAGNSLTAGENSSSIFTAYPSAVVGNLVTTGITWDLANVGVDGYTIANMQNVYPTGVAALFDPAKKNWLIPWEFTNTLKTLNAVQALAVWRTYCSGAMKTGYPVAMLTVLPRTGIIGDAAPSFEANRQLVNTQLRSDFNISTAYPYAWLAGSGGSGYGTMMIDVAAHPNIGQSGDNGNPAFYSPVDKIHLNDTGYALVAGYVYSGLLQMPSMRQVVLGSSRSSSAFKTYVS